MSGGKAGGKEAGVGGGMGAADFIKSDGSKGSAIYLQKDSEVSQSWKNFVQDDPVEYVIAYKSDTKQNPSSEIDNLYRIELYSLVVTAKNPIRVDLNGTEMDVADILSGTDIKLSDGTARSLWRQIGTFYIPDAGKHLKNILQDGAKFID